MNSLLATFIWATLCVGLIYWVDIIRTIIRTITKVKRGMK